LFGVGMDPETLLTEGSIEHHALKDAKLLRENYLKFFAEKR
jgi:hypothetical protein